MPIAKIKITLCCFVTLVALLGSIAFINSNLSNSQLRHELRTKIAQVKAVGVDFSMTVKPVPAGVGFTRSI